MNTETIILKCTPEEKKYAKALSKRVPGCKRPRKGSFAHGFKFALREYAKKEGISLKPVKSK